MKICNQCLIPESYPGAQLRNGDICRFCREYANRDQKEIARRRAPLLEDLEETLTTTRGDGRYDCIVLLSGGKDSTYLLHRIIEEYNLRTLALTVDVGGYTSDVAVANIQRTINALDVDHLVYTPPPAFARKMFRFLLQNMHQGGAVKTVCYVCHPLIEGGALDLAVNLRIPLILEGLSPGQPEPEIMYYEMPREHIAQHTWLPDKIEHSGLFTDDELAHFWDPARYPDTTSFPRLLAPLHVWDYDAEKVTDRVVELGLIPNRRWASPVYSNCRLVWLLMYLDLKNLGYNPYVQDFSQEIRAGRASRRKWLLTERILRFLLNHRILLGRHVPQLLADLQLRASDLDISATPEQDIVSHPRTG